MVAVFALVIPALLAICVLIIYDIRDVRKKVKAVVEVRRSKRLRCDLGWFQGALLRGRLFGRLTFGVW